MKKITNFLVLSLFLNLFILYSGQSQLADRNNYIVSFNGITAFIDYDFREHIQEKSVEFYINKIIVKDSNDLYKNLDDLSNFSDFYSGLISNFLYSNPENFIQKKIKDSIEVITLKRKVCWNKAFKQNSDYFEILPCECLETATTKISIEQINGQWQMSIRDEIPNFYENICKNKIFLDRSTNCFPYRFKK